MKTRTFVFILTSVLVVLLISSCVTTPKDVSPSLGGYFKQIEIGVTYRQERISANSDNFYRFTPQISGVHTISVTGLDSDLFWELHDNAIDAYMYESKSIIAEQDNDGTTDEVGHTPVLNAGQEYYLVVYNVDEISGDYDLNITVGRQ